MLRDSLAVGIPTQYAGTGPRCFEPSTGGQGRQATLRHRPGDFALWTRSITPEHTHPRRLPYLRRVSEQSTLAGQFGDGILVCKSRARSSDDGMPIPSNSAAAYSKWDRASSDRPG